MVSTRGLKAPTNSASQHFPMATLDSFLASPNLLLAADLSLSNTFLNACKALYDSSSNEDVDSNLFKTLYIEDRDADQIWEQLQLRNSKIIASLRLELNDLSVMHESALEVEEEESDEEFEQMDQDDEEDVNEDSDDIDADLDELDEDEYSEDIEMDEDEKPNKNNPNEMDEYADEVEDGIATGLDDEFFSLADMERFADRAERFDHKMAGERNEDDDDDQDLDELFTVDPEQFKNDPDLIKDEDDDEDNANDLYYQDFFEAPRTLDKGFQKRPRRNAHDPEEDNKPQQDNDLEAMNEDENNFPEDEEFEDEQDQPLAAQIKNLFNPDDEDDFDTDKIYDDPQQLSTFEKQQLKLKETIANLEAEAIAERPWALRGEVASKDRPVNSLLEEHVEVEFSNKPVPVITEEVTQSLEELIKQRIKDNLFDDVERRIAPPDVGFDPSRRIEINDEKSSKGLGEIYESEYLAGANKPKSGKEIELSKKHEEINSLFNELCADLDALCNWHYTPKPPQLEIQVLNEDSVSVPAISMEDVTPAAVSTASLVTAKEAFDGKAAKTSEEMSANEKTKLRQKVKRAARKDKLEVEKIRKAEQQFKKKIGADIVGKAASRKSQKKQKEKALEGLLGQQNVTIIGDKGNEATVKGQKKSQTKARVVGKGDSLVKDKKGVRSEMLRL
ncbi:U3 snoRNP protein [Nowakowskiella sp. JEL0407]|nr:U3 snoRNP protein [Nowakowskiella sp. JEL0407]